MFGCDAIDENGCRIERDEDPDNKERAARAQAAVEAYQKAYTEETGDQQAPLSGLLTDLMHYCGQSGLDFDYALESARVNFSEEI
jgi:hypothetical protein